MDMYWSIKADELVKEFIELQINYNDYYGHIKKAYDKDTYCINTIFKCWNNFADVYSIYKVMDSIENFMEEYKVDSVEKVVEDDRFYIYD